MKVTGRPESAVALSGSGSAPKTVSADGVELDGLATSQDTHVRGHRLGRLPVGIARLRGRDHAESCPVEEERVIEDTAGAAGLEADGQARVGRGAERQRLGAEDGVRDGVQLDGLAAWPDRHGDAHRFGRLPVGRRPAARR